MLLALALCISSCKKTETMPPLGIDKNGLLTIYYTSQRGANPKIVDGFAIIAGVQFDGNFSHYGSVGMPCFFVPPGGLETVFREQLKLILTKYDWAEIDKIKGEIEHDFPLRQLCMQSSGKLYVYDVYGDPYGDYFDERREKALFMYMRLINEIRLLGETHGIYINIVNKEIIRKGGGVPGMVWGHDESS
jgi:hypothetical protein